MYCTECGKAIPDGVKFCPECGTALEATTKAAGAAGAAAGAAAAGATGTSAGAAQPGQPYTQPGYAQPQPGQQSYTAPGYAPQQSYAQPYVQPTVVPGAKKDRIVAGLLAIFLGWLGIHKFYLGFTAPGVIYLVISLVGLIFGGVPTLVMAVLAIIEGIMYLTKSNYDFYQLYEVQQKEWF